MKKILIADDDEFTQRILSRIIEQLGFEADLVNDGEQLLKNALKEHYLLIISDIEMPKKSGIEVIHTIRNDFPNSLKHVPVIALTGHKDSEYIKILLKEGFDGHISKPFSTKDIETCINETIEKLENPDHKEENGNGLNGINKLINLDRINEFAEGDEGFIKDIITVFIDNAPELIEIMEEALEKKDWEGIRQSSHKLSSQLSFLGADNLALMSEKLETLAKFQKGMDEVKDIVHIISESVKNLVKHLKSKNFKNQLK